MHVQVLHVPAESSELHADVEPGLGDPTDVDAFADTGLGESMLRLIQIVQIVKTPTIVLGTLSAVLKEGPDLAGGQVGGIVDLGLEALVLGVCDNVPELFLIFLGLREPEGVGLVLVLLLELEGDLLEL